MYLESGYEKHKSVILLEAASLNSLTLIMLLFALMIVNEMSTYEKAIKSLSLL
jgi:hypothetical protein